MSLPSKSPVMVPRAHENGISSQWLTRLCDLAPLLPWLISYARSSCPSLRSATTPPGCFVHRSALTQGPSLSPFLLPEMLVPWLYIYISNAHSFFSSSLKHHLVNEASLTTSSHPDILDLPPSALNFFLFHLTSIICYAIYSFSMYIGSCLFPPTKMSTAQGQKSHLVLFGSLVYLKCQEQWLAHSRYSLNIWGIWGINEWIPQSIPQMIWNKGNTLFPLDLLKYNLKNP